MAGKGPCEGVGASHVAEEESGGTRYILGAPRAWNSLREARSRRGEDTARSFPSGNFLEHRTLAGAGGKLLVGQSRE